MAAIAAVLAMYEPDLIREVTDPRTGISTSEKFASFMPNSGELKAYCDAIAARRARMQQFASLPRAAPASRRLTAPRVSVPGAWANVFVPQGHARYERLCAWAEGGADERLWKFGVSSDRRPGIWISREVWDGNGEAMPRPEQREAAPAK